jgi:hypothetical protein
LLGNESGRLSNSRPPKKHGRRPSNSLRSAKRLRRKPAGCVRSWRPSAPRGSGGGYSEGEHNDSVGGHRGDRSWGVGGYFVRKLLDARQIRYTRLYERRAEVIDQLYEGLFEAGDLLRVWGSMFGYQERQGRDFERRYDALYRYYRANALWVDDQTREKLDTFFKEARDVHNTITDLQEFSSPKEWNEVQSSSERPRTKAEARAWVREKVEKEIPNLMEQLRDDFREILEISDLRDRGTRS